MNTPSLTPRERKVAELVAEGLTARQIGTRLGISPHTVRTYIDRIGRLLPGRGSVMRRIAVWWTVHTSGS
jgi:DNA-binding CsgD family transcriptional regulator